MSLLRSPTTTGSPSPPPSGDRAQRTSGDRLRQRAVLWLFTVTLFVSAGLVFLIQPMFAKFILPLFGSTPSVWNASMVFFQTALLGAYLYAHVSTRRLGVRRQAALHMALLALGLLALPIGVPALAPPADSSPLPHLLALLALTVGLPFFVVSTTAPLLQRWLADTDHPAAADPYFLYRASNLGSVLGLLAYPLALEPGLRLGEQGRLWSAGYVLLAALVAVCGVVVWRSRPAPSAGGALAPPVPGSMPVAADEIGSGGLATSPRALTAPSPARRLRWVGLAFVPSSLMLATTTFLTTDIAPIPLLWVVPLSLYLLSFIIVFSPGRHALSLHRWMVPALPGLAVVVAIGLLVGARDPLWLVMLVHLVAFFVAAMVCHGELARDRPVATSLTGFYLLVALGGALGGAFTAIAAPAVFDSLLEYPLAVVLACLCLPGRAPRIAPGRFARRLDFALPLAVGAVAVIALALVSLGGDFVSLGGEETNETERVLAMSVAAGIALTFARRPLRFGLAVGAIVAAGLLPVGATENVIYRDRSFFGAYRVVTSQGGSVHELIDGTTTHGIQDLAPGRNLELLSYYRRDGPIGQLMYTLSPAMTTRAAIVGLGAGTMACYARPGDRWTFYEIDPAVERIARDPRLFTYLRDCPGRYDVVLGDARLSLSRAADRRYGLIVLDAFASDAIPTHLLTREALALYRSRLRAGGVLAFHISNNYLALEPVVGDLARDAGLACVAQQGVESDWVAMAQRKTDFGATAVDWRWHECPSAPDSAVWTDDFSNLVEALDLHWGVE